MITRREALAGAALFTTAGASSATAGGSFRATGAESAKLFTADSRIKPATFDRLPLAWNKARMKALQTRLAAKGLEGILLTDPWNIIYYTGLYTTVTERLLHAFIPTGGTHPIWFYPRLERELVETWWFEDGDAYFDVPNVAGSAPQDGKLVRGETQEVWRWALEGLKTRGFAGKKLAADRFLSPSAQQATHAVLGAPFASAEEDCLYLRLRKTPEELELTRRAYIYLDRIHAFVRDLVLTRGTDLTDFEVGMAAKQFGTELIMADVKPNGELHQAVGIHVDVMCHAGKTTGYGHPNQFLYSRIERGKPLQFAALLQIGGCGGELYRPYMIAPRTQHMEKLWSVSRDCCLLERDLLRKGARCSDIAWAIHQEQIKRGVQQYVYNRPAHGQGMEGHQPPYIALGDHSLLDTGMCLSAEPALFDPQNGVGVNFSDMFVVEPEGPPLQMSRLPWSEEWAWIKL